MDEDILAWFRQQTADVQVALPERMPGEPDATPEQKAEIGRLAKDADAAKVGELGTWQAAYLIQRLREERRELEARATATTREMQAQRDNGGCLWVATLVVAVCLLVWWLR
jgi:hypothetical protein